MFSNIFNNKKIIITGHTGFKGSWLTLWLLSLGADICGISLNANTKPSHFEKLNLKKKISHHIVNLKNYKKTNSIINNFKPDYFFHLAAQPLVSKAYMDPLNTFETNIMGTINVLESLKNLNKKCTAILVTSDKSYKNLEWQWGYRENDLLGGDEPYGASKAATEIVINSYFQSYIKQSKNLRIGIGRAGNVIGGGDWSNDRIIPDAIKAWINNSKLKIRNPHSTRPWQFVLEPLSGYLCLAEQLTKNKNLNGEPFNFGPNNSDKTVNDLIKSMSKNLIKLKISHKKIKKNLLVESSLLKLNCEKAERLINWKSALNFDETVNFTSNWYKEFYNSNHNIFQLSIENINKYYQLAKRKKIYWALK